MAERDEAWYAEGLAFSCTRCGNCCTGEPGYVWVTDEEIEELAELVGLTVVDFLRTYVRQVGEHRSLIERPNGDCVFWDAVKGCTVYSARPVQCRTWPFWPTHLANRRSWARLQQTCPGAGQGEFHEVEEIEAQARLAAVALRVPHRTKERG